MPPLILTAGLSPAWQQLVVLESLHAGEVNRAREVHWCASGKVLNVGLAVSRLAAVDLGASLKQSPLPAATIATRTLALIGGPSGDAIRRDLESLGVPARWVPTRHATRVCTTLLDRSSGQTTEIVENAGPIQPAELNDFRTSYLEESRGAEIVILTGSFPTGTPASLYRELLTATKGRAIIDAQGPPLIEALAAKPFVVKPNREELGRTLGRDVSTEADLHAAMRELNRLGAEWVVVTAGKERVWVSSAAKLFSFEPPTVAVVNPIGSGDCLAAGIAVGLARGLDLPDSVLLGIAAAADNVRHLLPARLEPAGVRALHDSMRSSAG